jgi:molecular chaperone DnaK
MPAPRGVPQIEVSFDIDANGILSVSAKDKATGKVQNIRIEASSGLSKDEIEKMKREAEANADADKKAKEEVDKINAADGSIFQSEKQLKDYGEKIPAEKKAPIEEALKHLKEAYAAKDLAKIDTYLAELNKAWEAASQELYAAMNTQQQAQGGTAAGAEQQAHTEGGKDDNVQDVSYEEVKDDKK